MYDNISSNKNANFVRIMSRIENNKMVTAQNIFSYHFFTMPDRLNAQAYP